MTWCGYDPESGSIKPPKAEENDLYKTTYRYAGGEHGKKSAVRKYYSFCFTNV